MVELACATFEIWVLVSVNWVFITGVLEAWYSWKLIWEEVSGTVKFWASVEVVYCAVKSGATSVVVVVNWFKFIFSVVIFVVVCSGIWKSVLWNWEASWKALDWPDVLTTLPTWDNLNFFSSSIELIISWVFGLTVWFTILEGSNPISLLKFTSVVVVVVVVVVAAPCCMIWDWASIMAPAS